MPLYATFRGGPADNTDRSYPHISAVLPALWWTRDTILTPRPPTGLPGAHLPPSVERGDRLAGQDGVAALIDRNSGAAYRLCCPDPARDGVWIYVISDPPSTSGARSDELPSPADHRGQAENCAIHPRTPILRRDGCGCRADQPLRPGPQPQT